MAINIRTKRKVDTELNYIKRILRQNKNKSFVQRILNPQNYPVLKNIDGSTSTHSMSWGETEGKFVVFPTVLYDNKINKLKRFDSRDAYNRAMRSKNFIMFDDATEADWFSKSYKQIWDKY